MARPSSLLLVLVAIAFLVPTVPIAASSPATPDFGPSIDPYAAYDGQDTCDPTEKPGAQGLRSLLLATYPGTTNLGIVRACSSGEQSEHKEGRAFDWGIPAGHGGDASDLLSWLLKTDAYGNPHANARRLGIMYMIWNQQMWRSYRANEGWLAYTGANPHTDHVHFSLSWDGAMKRTTWWTYAAPSPPPATDVQGLLARVDCLRVEGRVWDPSSPGAPVPARLRVDGAPVEFGSVSSFAWDVPAGYRNGYDHRIELEARDLQTNEVRRVAAATMPSCARAATNGQLVVSVFGEAVYLLHGGVAHHVASGAVLDSWGMRWSSINRVPDDVLAQFTVGNPLDFREGTLLWGTYPHSDNVGVVVDQVGDAIDGAWVTRWIVDGATLEACGYHWDWFIADAAVNPLTGRPASAPVATCMAGQRPDGQLVQDPVTTRIYVLETVAGARVKRWIPSGGYMDANGYRWDRVIAGDPTDLLAYPDGPDVTLPEGALFEDRTGVYGDAIGAVEIVERVGGVLRGRWIPDGCTLEAYGLVGEPVAAVFTDGAQRLPYLPGDPLPVLC